MNALDVFSASTANSIVERLDWVLLHSLWQFAAIAILSTLGDVDATCWLTLVMILEQPELFHITATTPRGKNESEIIVSHISWSDLTFLRIGSIGRARAGQASGTDLQNN